MALADARFRKDADAIVAANAIAMKAARERGLDAAMLDRLELNAARVEAMAKGLDDIAALSDPVGEIIARWERPNGLKFSSFPFFGICPRDSRQSTWHMLKSPRTLHSISDRILPAVEQ